MTNGYARQKATAVRLIKKYGGPVTITRQVVIENPDKPWEPATEQPVIVPDVMCAFLPTNERQNRKLQLMKGTDVPTGLEIAYIANLPFELGVKDTITKKNGTVYRIFTMDAIDPDQSGVIVYEVYVRR
jgi:hypothetical protein